MRRRTPLVMIGALAVSTPIATHAQKPVRRPMPNACAALETVPSPLVNGPEGQTVLRLRRELESASAELARSRQLMGEDAIRLARLRARLDSITLELASGRDVTLRAVSPEVRSFWLDRSAFDSVTRVAGPQMDSLFRVMGPRLDSLTRVMGVRVDSLGRLMGPRLDSLSRVMGPRLDSLSRVMGPRLDSLARVMEPRMELIIRQLQPQIAEITEQAGRIAEQRRLTVVQGQPVAAPRGQLGLAMSGAQVRTVEPTAGVFTSHCEYPMVESVETRSPAAQAGIVAGDTVVAYNGRDLKRWAVNYPELLVPGDTVRVRIRRAGKASDKPVAVAARAPREFEIRLSGDTSALRAIEARGRLTFVPRPMANALATLAGAEFASMDDDFFANLGLKPGVIVLRVTPKSPAADAGLRSGDVIRRVNDTPVRDAVTLRRMVLAAAGDVRLTVQTRGAKERVLRLPKR